MHKGVKLIHEPVPNPNRAQNAYRAARLLAAKGSHKASIQSKVTASMTESTLKAPIESDIKPGSIRPRLEEPFKTEIR